MSSRRSQARALVFTWNNPPAEAQTELFWRRLVECGTNKIRYFAGQIERGASGTLHVQGYVRLSKPTRYGAFKRWLGSDSPHIEPRMGTHEEARDYVTKEDTRVAGPWIFGEEPQQGARNDFVFARETFEAHGRNEGMKILAEKAPQLIVRHPSGVEKLALEVQTARFHRTMGIYVFGRAGLGKTPWFSTRRDSLAHQLGDRVHYHMGSDKWWDGYDGQDVIVWDEFAGEIKFSAMKRLLSDGPLRVEIKGSTVQMKAKYIIFIANRAPWEQYGNVQDREPWWKRLAVDGQIYHVRAPANGDRWSVCASMGWHPNDPTVKGDPHADTWLDYRKRMPEQAAKMPSDHLNPPRLDARRVQQLKVLCQRKYVAINGMNAPEVVLDSEEEE